MWKIEFFVQILKVFLKNQFLLIFLRIKELRYKSCSNFKFLTSEYYKKSLAITLVIFLFVFLFILPVSAQNENDRLAHLIDIALKNNPEYSSMKNKLEAAKVRISPAGALPDPSLSLAFINLPVNSFSFDQEPMTGKKISIMQMFPFPGKLGLKKDMAAHQASIMKQQVAEFRLHLEKNIKLLFYNIFYLDKSIEIISKNRTLINQIIKSSEIKYSVGKGLQQDVLIAQVELLKLEDKLISLGQKRENSVFQLNKFLNRKPDTEFSSILNLEEAVFNENINKLIERGLTNRPLIISWRELIEKNKKNKKLAELAYFPDFSLGAAYTQRDNLQTGVKMNNFLSVEVKLNLPLYFYKKQLKKVEESQFQIISVQQQYLSIKNDVIFQIEKIYSNLNKNRKLINLYHNEIIPHASLALKSAMAGYQVDKADFELVLTNQMNLFSYELEYYRVLSEMKKNIAELAAAVGDQ